MNHLFTIPGGLQIGDTVTLNAVAVPVEPPPAPDPDPVEPAPLPPVTFLPSPLKAGETYDLAGGTVTLDKSLVVPAGNRVLIQNGRIEFAGDGGKVGSGGMSCFQVGNGAAMVLESLAFGIPEKCSVARLSTGGWISLNRIWQERGCLLWCSGGKFAEVVDCSSDGVPAKYWLANFDARLDKLRISTSHDKPIRQGKSEAAVRIMQVNDSLVEGLYVIGSNFKQGIQDRPGGKPGEKYKQHVWRNVKTTGGGITIGNFDDPSDVNAPFGTLELSRWEGCNLDKVHRSKMGGVKKIEIVK